jgi:phospholipid/cholesterol/gamma-HCH transport system substrate-binding protein
MAENTTEVLVGAGVLAAALGFAIYAGQLTGFGGTGGSYDLMASFRSVEGVSVGTDVRLAGVKVGTVSALRLDPETFRAETRLSVEDAVQLPDDTSAVIASEGLLGGNFVELLPGGSLETLPPGSEIVDTQGAVSLLSLLLRYVAGGESDTGDAAGDAGQ